LNTTLTPHSIIHGDACFAYFNKIWGIPAEGHDIYSGLMDRLGESSCCDDRDCRPAHYRITSAGVERNVA